MALVEVTGMLGANLAREKRQLPLQVGVASLNQKPSRAGHMEPWPEPPAVPLVSIPASPQRTTVYRMGRDALTPAEHWLSWPEFVHVIRGFDPEDPTERTYYTGAGSPKWTDNTIALASLPYPTAFRELAVPQPTSAPTVTLNTDGSTGDPRQPFYVYTWVNEFGWESAPSPPTESPAARPGAVLDLDPVGSPPAGAYNINRIRWYRTQAINATDAEFYFLREYAIGATGQQDDGRALNTQDDPLPTDPDVLRIPLPSTATWLTSCWNQFAAALAGKTVRFCVPNLIYAWPLGMEYALSHTPVGQAAFAQRLMVFTTAGCEIFTGTDPEAMDQKPMELPACVSPRSIVAGETFVMWAAKDGLMYYGTDGFRRLTLSLDPKHWEALNPETIMGAFYDGLYIGTYQDGAELKGFVVDPSNPDGIYPLAKGYHAAYWDKLLRKLFVLDGGTLKEWDAGTTMMTATFESKTFRQPAHIEGEWLEILCDTNARVRVWTDDTQVYDRVVATGQHRLADGTGGRDWRVEIQASAPVQALVIE
jgi:hypothetical protein